MSFRLLRRGTPAVLAAVLLAGFVGAGPASAAAPPFEDGSNAAEVGTITFYDATGHAITSGPSDTQPFAAYAVGSVAPQAGFTQSELVFANPDPNSVPAVWFNRAIGNYNARPGTSLPAAMSSVDQNKQPIAIGTSGDLYPDYFLQNMAKKNTAAGYVDVIQVRLQTVDANNLSNGNYDVADIQVDTAAHTWTQVYPTPAKLTVPGVPTKVAGTAGNGSVALSWTAPASNGNSPITGYSVKYEAAGSSTFVDAKHAGTTTSQTITGLTNGTAYTVEVAAINAVGTGAYATSSPITPKAPDATSLTITAAKSVVYGKSTAVGTTLTDTTTRKPLPATKVTLKSRASSGKPWATVSTVVTSSAGMASVLVTPKAATQYEWVYAGDSSHAAATSTTATVAVTQTVTAAVDHSSIKHGATVKIYGVVAPAVAGRVVTLQQRSGTSWKTLKVTAKVAKQKQPNGKTVLGYTLSLKVTAKGSFTYRVSAAAGTGLGAGNSGSVAVKST